MRIKIKVGQDIISKKFYPQNEFTRALFKELCLGDSADIEDLEKITKIKLAVQFDNNENAATSNIEKVGSWGICWFNQEKGKHFGLHSDEGFFESTEYEARTRESLVDKIMYRNNKTKN